MTATKDANPDVGNDADSNNRFLPDELALFLDRKGRAYLQTLTEGEEFHCHLGFIAHSEVIGKPVGGWYTTNRGHVLLGIRPTLGDYVRLMPRGPQVIYAKDLGNIVSMADIFPGATVVEAGLGSGALTTGLLRAVGPTGRLVSYEINESVVAKAESNVKSVISDTSRWTVKVGDIAEGIDRLGGLVDYVCVNVSSPNTPGLRDLQTGSALDQLLRRTRQARDDVEVETGRPLPLFLKIAPDLTAPQVRDLAERLARQPVDALP